MIEPLVGEGGGRGREGEEGEGKGRRGKEREWGVAYINSPAHSLPPSLSPSLSLSPLA